jgi:hypothetical protein
MENNSRYFKQAISDIQENYLSADGWQNVDNWDNAGGFDAAQEAMMASGEQVMQPRPPANSQSIPYWIILENTTTATVENVTIFDSATKFSDYSVSGISITWGYSGITYNQVLGRINSGQVFKVGQTRIVASSTTTGRDAQQVLKPITLQTKTIDGQSISRQLVMQKDSYQQITNQVDSFYPYSVDSMTSLIFNILGSTTINVYLYPIAAVNPFNALKGEVAPSQYGNPKVNPYLSK